MTITRSHHHASESTAIDPLSNTPASLSPAPSDNGDQDHSSATTPSAESSSDRSSPLQQALLYSVTNNCSSTDSIRDELAVANNPRPLRNVMRDGAEYWVTNDGDPWHLRFIAKLDITGHFTKLGPYFSLQTGGIDLVVLPKAKAQIELRPLDEDDISCPHEAIKSSRIAVDTLLALCSEVEVARNQKIAPEKRPSVTQFLKPHLYENRYSFSVQTEPLFKGLPNPQSAETPIMTRANIGQSGSLMSPSKAKARAAAVQTNTNQNRRFKKAPGSRIWGIDDLPDPDSRYATVKSGPHLKDVTIQGPEVFDTNGVFVHPGEYDSKLCDGDIVEVDVILKLWTFKPSDKDPTGSRIYQLILQGMKVMPYDEYIKKTVVPSRLPVTNAETVSVHAKNKRKAADLPVGQSPSKKTSGKNAMVGEGSMEVDE